ncbi:MAG: hypothetical protein DMG13_24105 [Acidobacteria bacterium]|nr:MAG: hypothetical protein DMG13_24105 [Acidobacteriota bacterium]
MRLKTNAMKLPVWTLNGGSRGGDGFRLQDVEFDGFITLADSTDTIHLPWLILPHRAADVTPSKKVHFKKGNGNVVLSNKDGALNGRVDVFSLLGTSREIPPRLLPGPGDNFAVIDMKSVGARLVNSGSGPAIQFAINTFGVRAHPNYPAEFDIYVDANRDGEPDYIVLECRRRRQPCHVCRYRLLLHRRGFKLSERHPHCAAIRAGPERQYPLRFFSVCLRQLLHGKPDRRRRRSDLYAVDTSLRGLRHPGNGSTCWRKQHLHDSGGPRRRCRLTVTDRNPADVPRRQNTTRSGRDHG